MEKFDKDIWSVVQELGENERHFNNLQHNYRVLASTWLLAMFAGVGFVLTAEKLPISYQLIMTFLGVSSAFGITLLWNLDLRVYHQLLDSCFVEGLKIEKNNLWLPQLRSNMLKTQNVKPLGVLARVVWFYILGNSISLALAGFALASWVQSNKSSILIMLATAAVVLIWGWLIKTYTKSPILDEWLSANKCT